MRVCALYTFRIGGMERIDRRRTRGEVRRLQALLDQTMFIHHVDGVFGVESSRIYVQEVEDRAHPFEIIMPTESSNSRRFFGNILRRIFDGGQE